MRVCAPLEMESKPAALAWVVARALHGDAVYVVAAKKDASNLYVRVLREDTAAVHGAEVLTAQRGQAAVDEFLQGVQSGAALKLVVDATSVSVRVNNVEVRAALVAEADFNTSPSGGVKCSAMQRRWEASHALQLAILRGLQPK